MNIVKKIKSLLQEAELYHTQGLLNEAMGKYNKATELIQSDELLKSKQNLLDGVSKKIHRLEKDIEKVEQAPKTPEMPPHVHDLIKKLYTFSADKDEDAVALDGAIALAKFGQYESALSEFNELIKKDSLRVVAAKNILRCHMALSSVDEAFSEYEHWLSNDMFSPDQIDKLRVFFEGILEKEGIDRAIPAAKVPEVDEDHLIEMPEIDGIEVLQTLKNQPDPPVVINHRRDLHPGPVHPPLRRTARPPTRRTHPRRLRRPRRQSLPDRRSPRLRRRPALH